MTAIAADRLIAADLSVINMLWIGERLGPLERACIRSVMACGHALHLWHYAPIDGVPEGVVLRDANTVIDGPRVFRHKQTGSYALFSNLFRYTLLRNGCGLWLDSDVYLLRPLTWHDGHVLGWERPGVVATAVMGLPPESPALAELLGYFDARKIPPWLPARWRLRYALERMVSGKYRLDTMPWGYLGPMALTRMVQDHALADRVQAQEVFSPFGYHQAAWIFRSDTSLDAHVTPKTVAVHLFNQMIRDVKDTKAPAGSFLERLQREGA